MEVSINVGGANWEAANEPPYTIVMADNGTEYIRTLSGLWEPHKEPELFEDPPDFSSDSEDDNIGSKKKKKRITAYNIFMKITLKSISMKHPNMDCKERMKMAAELWKDAKN